MEIPSAHQNNAPTLTLASGTGIGKAWHAGQLLPARVLATAPSRHEATLEVAGQRVRAHTAIPLQTGQALKLVVVQAGPQPQLQILAGEKPDTVLAAALRNLLPQQTALTDIMRSIGAMIDPQHGNRALPPAVTAMIQALLAALPDQQSLSGGSSLKQALQHSGVFFEALLAADLTQGDRGNSLPDDLKARLIRLSDQLRQAVERAGPNGRSVDVLETLLTRTESALARLQTLQVQNLIQADQAPAWLMELPVYHDHHRQDEWQFRISREGTDEQTTWQLRLRFTIDPLGAVEAVIVMQPQQINVYFTAEQETTAEKFRRSLEVLRNDLTGHGLAAGQLKARCGPVGEFLAMQGLALLDEQA